MRSSYLTPRAISLHIAVLITVPGFLALGWWQLHRALGGNWLSWMYTVEWPFFALYGVVMWWRLVTEQRPDAPERKPSSRATRRAVKQSAVFFEESERLAEYNAYLRSLNNEDGQEHQEEHTAND